MMFAATPPYPPQRGCCRTTDVLILLVTALGAFASLAAIVFELGAPTAPPNDLRSYDRAVMAVVHTTFALHYAHDFTAAPSPAACSFRGGDKPVMPTIGISSYFSFVIGMTAQVPTSASPTGHPPHRDRARHHLVRVQHRALALMVNIAASAI